MTFKNLTFLAGLGWLIYGALFFNYPDWDVGVSLVMAISTYFSADWVWRAVRERRYTSWPLATILAWWCVDGSYWAYWSVVNPSVMIREGQWQMSLCLFLLCGAIWSLKPAEVLDALRRWRQGSTPGSGG